MRARIVLRENPEGRLDWGNEWLWGVESFEGRDWMLRAGGDAHDEGEARSRAVRAAERLRSPTIIEELP